LVLFIYNSAYFIIIIYQLLNLNISFKFNNIYLNNLVLSLQILQYKIFNTYLIFQIITIIFNHIISIFQNYNRHKIQLVIYYITYFNINRNHTFIIIIYHYLSIYLSFELTISIS